MLAPNQARAERPVRILMVLESDFTQRGGGGAESQVRTLARELKRIGHEVMIVTPLFPHGPQVMAEECYGVPVRRLPYPRIRWLGAGVMCLRFVKLLLGPGQEFDAWHVHIGHHLGALTCLVGSLIGKPVVVKISGSWELEQGLIAPGRGLVSALGRSWLKRASVTQAISTRIRGELIRCGFPADRVLVLPNAIDTRRFRTRDQARSPDAPFTAVFTGRLVNEKGLPTLFDAWAEAFRGRSDVRLRVVGGGPLESALRAQVESLAIGGQVEFLGHSDRVEDILGEADVGLLPSRIEGLSNTLLEFMASGLPSIASRVSGSEDFIKPGENGWLFPVGDAAALAACLREAASLPRERLFALGKQARADVEAAAALPRVTGRLLSLYRGAHPHELKEAS